VNYTVVWLTEAEDELAVLWMSSADRAAVTRAAAEIDRRLAANGPTEGESRPSGRRITFEPPPAVIFRAYPEANVITVTRVWEYQ
jgi:hypothetical protein